jgi:hypothetical protein
MNIDAKLDELLAKFDEIMGDEGTDGGEEDFGDEEEMGGDDMGGDDMGGEEEMGGEFGGEEEPVAEAWNFEKKGSGKSGSAASGKSGSAASGKSGSAKKGSAASGKSGSAASGKPFESKRSSSELMREYVDRIGEIYSGEGDASEGTAVGATGKKTSINGKSITGPGADFGGTNKNIARGGSNESPDGKSIPKASNEYTKGEGTIKSGNVNVPGGIKGKAQQSTGKEYSKEHPRDGSGVGAGTKSVMGSQNTKSVQKQNLGKK